MLFLRSLRFRLLLSHLVLVCLMLASMLGAIYSLRHLGGSIDRILKANYASVIAAQDMKETLERQDSAATFFLAGDIAEARAQYADNRDKFLQAYNIEANNITEAGEQQLADQIGQLFRQYTRRIGVLLNSHPPESRAEIQKNSAYYFSVLKPRFLQIKNLAQKVLELNEAAIKRASDRAKAEANRATLTGIGVTVAACVTAVLLALRMIGTALRPLRSLARQAEEIGAGHWMHRIEVNRNDEIGALAASFNNMAEKLREAWELEEQRLHRAEVMSDAALENLYDPVIVTDGDGKVVHWNRAASGLFGPEEPALGRPIAAAVGEQRIAEAISNAIHQEQVSAHEGEAGEVGLAVGEGKRTYRLRATPMADDNGGLLGAVAVLEDITHLRELDRLKTEFIGVASHEMKTPVTSMLLFVQLLQEGAGGPLTAQQTELVTALRADLERLERMMRDLLDIARLEAGVTPPRFEILPPRRLATAACDATASLAEAKNVALINNVSPDLPLIRADLSQLTRVLVNLINNGVRHTPAGGSITVAAELDKASPLIWFRVTDTGEGIPKEYLERIFERFVQVPGATGHGSGLGLSIAKTIVTAHGGSISAESELGHGTTVTFSIPIAPMPDPGRNRTESDATHLSN